MQTMDDPPSLEPLLEFAVEAAQLAGAFTLGYFGADPPHELKADLSPVTLADRGAEERLRARIARQFPEHGIVGEEFGEVPGTTPGRWILDPIDGTVSFLSGVPLYAVLIAFEWRRDPLVGVVHFPALGQTLYAARGLGCRCNGRRVHVSKTPELMDARFCCTSPKQVATCKREAGYLRLRAACRLDRGWSDAYAYALLAMGSVEIALDPVMELWDVAPLYPLIEEAGGRITAWDGRRDPYARESIASNGRLHEAALRTLAGEGRTG